jgi:hypothetical protein
MSIVPVKLNGIFAYPFGGARLGRRLEHGQRTWRDLLTFSRLSVGFATLFVA